jgi:hypothetical protein
MPTYTYATTRTRTEAVVDQFDMFLRYAGVKDGPRNRILEAVKEKWITAVGVYLLDASQKRMLEAEVAIRWELYSDLVALEPTIRTDLPGWEKGAAPEITVIGSRFGTKAHELGKQVHFWVRFTNEIHRNPNRHRELCGRTGVQYGSSVPDWASEPQTRSYTIDALREVNVSLREAY